MNKKGKIRNANPLIIDNIRFKSKLEVYCYKRLKEEKIEFKYEEYTFDLMTTFKFNSSSIEMNKTKGKKDFKESTNNIRAITYTPDFVNLEQKWIIECKGYPNDAFPLKWKLFKRYLVDKNIKITLYVPRNQKHIDEVIQLIKNNNE
jgi:hypothetical protein